MQIEGARLFRRNALVGLVVGVPLSVVFLWLAVRGLQPGQVWGSLRDADRLDVALAVVLMGAIYSLQALRWRWITRHSAELPWRTFLRLIVSQRRHQQRHTRPARRCAARLLVGPCRPVRTGAGVLHRRR